jgi:TolB-like protein/cytochrome c-type biogenesis protein CcmH/NrfG
MAEIFISYARSTETQAAELAAALRSAGHVVWRDDQLPVHRDYADVIEEHLRAAGAVVVLWSQDAAKSQWVRAEADVAREAGKLVQVTLDGTVPPLPFNRLQCAPLLDWRGSHTDPGWLTLLASIDDLTSGHPHAVPAQLALPDRPSIAVMPLTNFSADPEQEYFVDALTEEIISALSRWRWFFVIARNSSFAYKNRQPGVRQVGQELGVRYIVSGSVRRVGDRVRVSVQLADAVDGASVWGDQFDRQLTDVLALQDEITEHVVRAIEPALVVNENNRLARKAPKDYSALECFQRGLWHLNKVSGAHYAEAIASFRECIARDPDLAVGHIGLARILYGGATIYGWSKSRSEDLQEAYAEARTAVALDPDDSDGHFALAGAALYLNRHDEALHAARRSVALNPNSAYGQFRLAQVLIYAGSPAEAIAPIERSLRHSPFDPQRGAMLGTLALAHYQARDYAEAERQARAAIAHDFASAHALLAASLVRQNRIDEARLALPPQVVNRVLGETIRLATYVNDADRLHLVEALQLATGSAAA